MADVDPRIAYLVARDAYTETRKLTHAHAMLVHGVGDQIRNRPAAFVDVTLQGKKSGGLYTSYDLTGWPTAEDLRRDFLSLQIAYDHCRALWENVPHERRASCAPPPSELGKP
jgi:hypothetical protein